MLACFSRPPSVRPPSLSLSPMDIHWTQFPSVSPKFSHLLLAVSLCWLTVPSTTLAPRGPLSGSSDKPIARSDPIDGSYGRTALELSSEYRGLIFYPFRHNTHLGFCLWTLMLGPSLDLLTQRDSLFLLRSSLTVFASPTLVCFFLPPPPLSKVDKLFMVGIRPVANHPCFAGVCLNPAAFDLFSTNRLIEEWPSPFSRPLKPPFYPSLFWYDVFSL